ncbi:N-acetyl-gamma-glutamyl-phosphate reductase [Bacillus horti]|uniref:N-acetyl-gamma-glutamyl-phosphate reductase n=1 Tax=Caldalkalibacillus horti TaxID=77523 RepID=A0ABT9VZW8_9BACI|nr:N-acetyl-gamma-glutamyl-phosphate reductase [Bacillus horti]MDQ0166540.1 N-acetyl-gamma-glutamyl-phosphate reductase [Bacillus horti]
MRVAVVGATGYSGVEVIRLLQYHPRIELVKVFSSSQDGVPLRRVFPHLTNIFEKELTLIQEQELIEGVDAVFFATPSGISKEWIPALIDAGVTCIDISGDFRLDVDSYKEWYKKEPAPSQYLEQAVYGLTEVYEAKVKEANLLTNPGCFPTASLLGLAPILKTDWINQNSIIIDAKTGVSGAGRGASLGTHYSELNDNLKAYKLGVHQHIPEIERYASEIAGSPIQVTFTTHLVPMTRGILSTIYVDLAASKQTDEIIELYKDYYKHSPFVRIRPEGEFPSTKEVYASNYCDIGLLADPRTGKLMIISVIDNVVKGAAGQAIQNLNVMQGWDQTTGLLHTPIYP